jgi:hypothetical protein
MLDLFKDVETYSLISFCGAGDPTQGLVHARLTPGLPCLVSVSSSPILTYLKSVHPSTSHSYFSSPEECSHLPSPHSQNLPILRSHLPPKVSVLPWSHLLALISPCWELSDLPLLLLVHPYF